MSIKADEKPAMLKAKDVRPNAFSENLGTDFIAVDGYGHPVARASDKETVERAAPNHSGVFTGKDFPKDGPKDNGGPDEPIMQTETGLSTTGPGIDATAIATQQNADTGDKPTFEDAVEGADKAKDDGTSISERKTVADVKETKASDDKPNKAEMDHDKDGVRGGTASRQRKPAGE